MFEIKGHVLHRVRIHLKVLGANEGLNAVNVIYEILAEFKFKEADFQNFKTFLVILLISFTQRKIESLHKAQRLKIGH